MIQSRTGLSSSGIYYSEAYCAGTLSHLVVFPSLDIGIVRRVSDIHVNLISDTDNIFNTSRLVQNAPEPISKHTWYLVSIMCRSVSIIC